MKSLIHTIHAFLFLTLLALSGCGQSEQDTDTDKEGLPVKITLAAATRATSEGSHTDDALSELRVLAFDARTGLLKRNEYIDPCAPKQTKEITILTGSYTFIFIGNESTDTNTKHKLATLSPETATIRALDDISFPESAFARDKNIPMFTRVDDVTIQSETVVLVAGTAIELPWKVNLIRMATRLDVTLSLTQNQYTALLEANNPPQLTISGIPAHVYLLPGKANRDATTTSRTVQINTSATDRKDELTVPEGNKNVTIKFDRIILPENIFDNKTTNTNGLQIKLTLAGTINHTFSTYAGVGMQANPKDYTFPRNNYLSLDGKLSSTNSTLEFEATVTGWVPKDIDKEL